MTKTYASISAVSAIAFLAGCAARGTTPQPASAESAAGVVQEEVPSPPVPSTPVAEVPDNVTEARPVMARLAPRGGISFGGAELFVAAFGPGWGGLPVKASPAGNGQDSRGFLVEGASTYFKGKSDWTLQHDATLRGHIEMECVAPVELQCIAVAIDIPAPPPFGLGDASAADYELPLSDGRLTRLSFPRPVNYHSQDSRQWGGQWTVRFSGEGGHLGHGTTRAFTPGERLVWDMVIAAPDGFDLAESKPLDITANDDWVRLDYRKDIVPGSALDLSGQGLQDAPAGKHGWLKSVGGHFEFEGLPGVEQRFYGVNLCFSANYPDHDVADRLVDRFVRLGYNTIRVHHHDGLWALCYGKSSGQPPAQETADALKRRGPRDDDIDRLDYFLARCFEKGLYVTTDLYVSRSVSWRDIGIDRDGNMDVQLYKTYVGIHDGAFADWCKWARAFLEHVNPYTGRAYVDEPGMPLISLINEGKLAMAWGGAGKGADPVVREAWREFGGNGADPAAPGANAIDSPHDRFDEWVNRRVWERCSAFVRSLGCRALLTNDNNGRWHGEGEGLTPLYDYVDSHFYVDHPQFLEQAWKLPSKCGNANPVKADLPAILHRGWAKGASKPYAISEWNFSGPGRYRGMGGILTGALAAEQEWDGLWRFAYSHSRDRLLDGKGAPGYFDCVTDPLIAASDRASVCLYLRRDCTPAACAPGACASAACAPAACAPATCAPGACASATCAPAACAPGACASATCAPATCAPGACAPALPSAGLSLDKGRGSMTLVTPRTCGGFAEEGRIDAGSFSFEIVGREVPATLWASSLDGQPLERSSRILVTHLTDIQGDGTRYADDTRRVILRWGKAPLIEVGSADVALRLDVGAGAAPPSVWALDTAGNRVAEVPATFEGGALRFRACTAGPEGGRIYYEIARQ